MSNKPMNKELQKRILFKMVSKYHGDPESLEIGDLIDPSMTLPENVSNFRSMRILPTEDELDDGKWEELEVIADFLEKDGLKHLDDLDHIILSILLSKYEENKERLYVTVTNMLLWGALDIIIETSNQVPHDILKKFGFFEKDKYQKTEPLRRDGKGRRYFNIKVEKLKHTIQHSAYKDLKMKLDLIEKKSVIVPVITIIPPGKKDKSEGNDEPEKERNPEDYIDEDFDWNV